MAGEVRGRMIEGAVQLLAMNGLQGTSFSEVLELTGAPRGSVYHHFPNGKDQLVGSAIELAGARATALIDSKAGESAEEVTRFFLAMWRSVLTRSNLRAGCAVLAVTVATDSAELLEASASVFRSWRTRLGAILESGGLPASSALSFATTLVAASEGAVVLSRAEQSLDPFDLVAEQLLSQLRAIERDTP
jgi:TetR/AcrR family transcriptional regulator, lmrAB and yxaGH operons repressor